VKLGEPPVEFLEFGEDERQRGGDECQTQRHRPRPKDPGDIFVQPGQRPLRIPTGQAQIENVSDAGPNSLVALLAVMLEQGGPQSEAQALQQAFFVEIRQ
jgi:hypothetical protein